MLFVIEHLEPKLSEWLYIEYTHAAQIVGQGRMLITNVKSEDEFCKLSRVSRVERKRVSELFEQKGLIVLDPRARNELTPVDFRGKKAIVIGGILGGDPPLGRTRELLTRSLTQALKRNIGKHQFPINGAVYVAKQVSKDMPLREVPIQYGIEIRIGKGHSTVLPYAYPLIGGKPLISRKLVTYLKRPWRLSEGS
ncbi:MAG TPA: hypothetical protein EYP46_02980 [Hadesarchaea archaeon]|nr:hypothetical protein [Hadesarchaea archaeon]